MKNKIIYSAKKYLNSINKNNILFNLKIKIIYITFILFIIRIGNFIPVYGIKLSNILYKIKPIYKEKITFNTINLLFNGYINKISIFSLGIMPYISASMLMQLLMLIIPFFKKLKNNEFENNKKTINIYIYMFTLILSIFYSFLTIMNINNILNYEIMNFNTIIFSVLSMVSGTMFLVWLSDQITNSGIGNGVSIIIFINIVSNIFKYISNIYFTIDNSINILSLIIIFIITYILINISVFIECSQRKILINYPKQYFFSRNFIKSSSSYLPIKINIPGVMPIIFSYSFLTFQNFLIYFMEKYFSKSNFLLKFILFFKPGSILFIIINILLIFLFSFLYTSISFNIKETSDNLKKTGAFITNIRPGNNTFFYIKRIVNKLIFLGSIYTNILCLVPEFIKYLLNLKFYFNGISLLITIIVSIEIITQIQTIIISTQYESILKKMNLY